MQPGKPRTTSYTMPTGIVFGAENEEEDYHLDMIDPVSSMDPLLSCMGILGQNLEGQ